MPVQAHTDDLGEGFIESLPVRFRPAFGQDCQSEKRKLSGPRKLPEDPDRCSGSARLDLIRNASREFFKVCDSCLHRGANFPKQPCPSLVDYVLSADPRIDVEALIDDQWAS